MPLVAHNDLPSFERLRQAGQTILKPERALHQDIRELHIGLLNMMPDAALGATERQFFRLVGESNPIAQFYVHPFTLEELPRSPEGQAHVERYYESFGAIREALEFDGPSVVIVHGPCQRIPEMKQREIVPFFVDEELCTQCEACLKVFCPAITLNARGFPEIHPTECTACTLCAQVCPPEAIIPLPPDRSGTP